MNFSVRARLFSAALVLTTGVSAFPQSYSGNILRAHPDFEVKNRVLVRYSGRDENVVIPESLGINRIGEKAFAGNALRSVTVPPGVDRIENRAFAGCAFLVSVSLPNTVTVVGYRAFFGCSSLETVVVPRSLRSIGGGAFLNCRSLQTLDLPAALRSIGARAFAGCTGMRELRLSRRTSVGELAFMGVPPGSIAWRN